MSGTSQLIVVVPNKFEEQQQRKQQTVPAEEINITVDFESDESTGQLIYIYSELL